MKDLTCFKAYDIRGRLGEELNENIAFRIGRAFASELKAKSVVIGHDIRPTSPKLSEAVTEGLVQSGCDVLDLGLSGTEEMYHATSHFKADGGICITASHNPIEYNGMKFVGRDSVPLDPHTEFCQIKRSAEISDFIKTDSRGVKQNVAAVARDAYVKRVLSFVDWKALRPLKILVNAGHGTAGPTFDRIAEALHESGSPLSFVRICHEPDGKFPKGIPNPLLSANQPITATAVREHGVDFGVAWDGDFDRCFFFDGNGDFVEGEYVVALLAEVFLAKHPGATIIHDPRVVWNTQSVVQRAGGNAVQSRTGHAFIKQAMRANKAVYGGEMSAHHYFRDFVYCDSGMIPWLMVAELVSRRGTLRNLIAEYKASFSSSGELNYTIDDADSALQRVRNHFESLAKSKNEQDGLSIDLGSWRFNIRKSNTEPVIRLNVESSEGQILLNEGVTIIAEILMGQ